MLNYSLPGSIFHVLLHDEKAKLSEVMKHQYQEKFSQYFFNHTHVFVDNWPHFNFQYM